MIPSVYLLSRYFARCTLEHGAKWPVIRRVDKLVSYTEMGNCLSNKEDVLLEQVRTDLNELVPSIQAG